MAHTSFYQWAKRGMTWVPNALIQYYDQLQLTSKEFTLIVAMLSFMDEDLTIDRLKQLSNQLGWDFQELFTYIDHLSSKGYLEINMITNQEGKKTDQYSIEPLFNAIERIMNQRPNEAMVYQTHQGGASQTHSQDDTLSNNLELVPLFEQEFKRSLSPMEFETLNRWLVREKYDEGLIRLALREAVIRNAYSLNYIDKILFTWQQQNITTVPQAQEQIQQFNQQQFFKTNSTHQSTTHNYDHLNIPLFKAD
ncbi:DnaD domain-containing protein [Dolosicoccus paucivorans]|uniref:DnaD domain-containing protein n=1 Tax=Dolosicoccus paucivorans TaxID=84521 RepID=UPI0008828D6E|nr:DnaD domain protein [Dolosicoccus paucivorans]SDI48381.1 DNA replication protein [Dolosicoccus paucivorans]